MFLTRWELYVALVAAWLLIKLLEDATERQLSRPFTAAIVIVMLAFGVFLAVFRERPAPEASRPAAHEPEKAPSVVQPPPSPPKKKKRSKPTSMAVALSSAPAVVQVSTRTLSTAPFPVASSAAPAGITPGVPPVVSSAAVPAAETQAASGTVKPEAR